MSPTGLYLGSENKQAHTLMLPADANDLMTIWKNPNLTRPGGVDKPAASAGGLSAGTSDSPFGPQETPAK
jgi:hypothetical protein